MVPLFAVGIPLMLAPRRVGSTLRKQEEIAVTKLINRHIGTLGNIDLFGHVAVVQLRSVDKKEGAGEIQPVKRKRTDERDRRCLKS